MLESGREVVGQYILRGEAAKRGAVEVVDTEAAAATLPDGAAAVS